MQWAVDEADKRIFWMSGMAGTGKTTIAYRFSELLHNSGLLGGTFFCSRSADAYNVHRIFPTLSYQLTQRFGSLGRSLADILSEDPEAIDRLELGLQFRDLIQNPIQSAQDFPPFIQ